MMFFRDKYISVGIVEMWITCGKLSARGLSEDIFAGSRGCAKKRATALSPDPVGNSKKPYKGKNLGERWGGQRSGSFFSPTQD